MRDKILKRCKAQREANAEERDIVDTLNLQAPKQNKHKDKILEAKSNQRAKTVGKKNNAVEDLKKTRLLKLPKIVSNTNSFRVKSIYYLK